MKRKLILLIGIVIAGLILYIFFTNSASAPEVKNNTIVFFGDSLVEGYGATSGNAVSNHLEELLGQPVINLGVSGDTTADGLARLDTVIEYDPGLVIVLLGGNDALRKRPMSETEANLREIIETFQANGSVVVLIGIRSNPFGGQFGAMYEDLAQEYELLHVPDALKGLFGRPEYMTDTIHPNDAGYAMLAKRLYDVIAPIYD